LCTTVERFGSQEATPAVDVYSLACVLYEALTGRKPFPGCSDQVIAAHLSSPPPQPSAVDPRVPVSFDAVVARGMAKHRDDRYGSADALGCATKRALSAQAREAAAPTVPVPQNLAAPYRYPPVSAQHAPPSAGPAAPGTRKYLLPALKMFR